MTSLLPPWLGDLMVSMKSGFGMVPALCQCPERPGVGALEWSKLVREVGSVNSPEAGRGGSLSNLSLASGSALLYTGRAAFLRELS